MPERVQPDAGERRRQLALYAVAAVLTVAGFGFLAASVVSFQRGGSESVASSGGEPPPTSTPLDQVAGERTPGTIATATATTTAGAAPADTPRPPTADDELPEPAATEEPTPEPPTSTPVPPTSAPQPAAPEPTATPTEALPTTEPTATEGPSHFVQLTGPTKLAVGEAGTYTTTQATWSQASPPDLVEWRYDDGAWAKVPSLTVSFDSPGCHFVWVRGSWFSSSVSPNQLVNGVAVEVGEVEGGCSSFSN